MTLTPTQKVILAAFAEAGAMTIPQVCEYCNLNYRSIYNTVPNNVELLRLAKLVHIADWQRQEGHGGLPKPIYAYGEGEDAARPKKKTRKEKYETFKKWRKKKAKLAKLGKIQERSIISTLLGV